jgi:hypothetical protein
MLENDTQVAGSHGRGGAARWGLLVMDRMGRIAHGAHSEQFTMAGRQFTWRVNIPWCMAERLLAIGWSYRESEAMTGSAMTT